MAGAPEDEVTVTPEMLQMGLDALLNASFGCDLSELVELHLSEDGTHAQIAGG